jgi:hypothetical protein
MPTTRLQLELVAIAAAAVRGIYGKEHDVMPERCRYLHPEAADDWPEIAPWAVVSDMFRSAESSLDAVLDGRGAQRPGYSAHNYGLATDLALEDNAAKHGLGSLSRLGQHLGLRRRATKAELDAFMAERGWFCHRRDHELEFEAWHFTHLGRGAVISPKVRTIVNYTEQRILHFYADQLDLDVREAQGCLAHLGLYGAEIDGDWGKRSKAALERFERAWSLPADGVLDIKAERTLAYVTAQRQLLAERALAA